MTIRAYITAAARAASERFGWTIHAYDGQVYTPAVSQSRTVVTFAMPSMSAPGGVAPMDGAIHADAEIIAELYHPERGTALDASENLMRWLHGRSFADDSGLAVVTGWEEIDPETVEGYVGNGYHGFQITAGVSLDFAPYISERDMFGVDFLPIAFRFTPTDVGNSAAVAGLPSVEYYELFADAVDVTGGTPALTGAFNPPKRFTVFDWIETAEGGAFRSASFAATLSGAAGYTADAIGLYDADGALIAAASAHALISKTPGVDRILEGRVTFDETGYQHSGELELDDRRLTLGGRGLRIDE